MSLRSCCSIGRSAGKARASASSFPSPGRISPSWRRIESQENKRRASTSLRAAPFAHGVIVSPSIRQFSSSPSPWQRSSSKNEPLPKLPVTKDPSHPSLYYHSLPPPDEHLVAISLLRENPVLVPGDAAKEQRTVVSKTVLGFLPADKEAGLNDFVENREFRDILHPAVQAAIESGHAPTVETEAMIRGSNGYSHVGDQRKIPQPDRRPEPEDIIASLLVEDGKVVPGTYEPQPMYRVISPDGVMMLPEGVDVFVIDKLKQILEQERKVADEGGQL